MISMSISPRLNRILAYFIDILIFIPVIGVQFLLTHLGYYTQIIGEIAVISFELWYFVYYVYKHERSFGKQFEQIKIMSIDGQRISLKQAFLRYISYTIFGLIQAFIFIYLILKTPVGSYYQLDFMDKLIYVKSNRAIEIISNIDYGYWVLSFLLAMFNKSGRTIADYIAGTIVVQES